MAGLNAYTTHIAEGINRAARNEFLCVREGEFDLLHPHNALFHGIGLLGEDIAEVADAGAKLIWSPRSDVRLYGETARAPLYDRLGVPIALGTNWISTGSMNMLRELSCADSLNAEYWDGYFTDEQLWRMATLDGAEATGTADVLGRIAPGYEADLVIFDGSVRADHRAVLGARPQDVVLVLRGGTPLFGEAAVVRTLASAASCEELPVCGASRRVCAQGEVAATLGSLRAEAEDAYPLFFCGAPPDEPTCVPVRGESVSGSTIDDGILRPGDLDGDGIDNAADNCPMMFNPVRPLDAGEQADTDGDRVGDVCDPCPLHADRTSCPSE